MSLAALCSAYDTSSESESEDISDQYKGPPSALDNNDSSKCRGIPDLKVMTSPSEAIADVVGTDKSPEDSTSKTKDNQGEQKPLLDFSTLKQDCDDDVVLLSGEAYAKPQIKQEPVSEESEDSQEDSDFSDSPSSDYENDNEDDSDKTKKKKKKKLKNKDAMEPPKVKGELTFKDLPPIEDLHISVPHEHAKPIGVVKNFVDPLVVVEAYPNTPALDIDSVLFLDEGDRALGHVFDVIGPVKQPLYCVRFNSLDHIEKSGITKGMLVYCAPNTQHASFVLLAQLERFKGTDASWKNDHEPPPEELVSSEDECDKMEKNQKKNGRRTARARRTVNPIGNGGQQTQAMQPIFQPSQVPGFYRPRPAPNRQNYRGRFPRHQRHQNPQMANFRPFSGDYSYGQMPAPSNVPNSPYGSTPAPGGFYPHQAPQYSYVGNPQQRPPVPSQYHNPYASAFPRYNHPFVQNPSWQQPQPPLPPQSRTQPPQPLPASRPEPHLQQPPPPGV